MAKKSKRSSGFKKFAITCCVLIVAQVAFLFLYSGETKVLTPREAVEKALKDSGDMSDARREKMRVQLALADFRSRTGAYPKSLNELMPDYFNAIPPDSETGKPMEYIVSNGRYRLGTGTKRDAGSGNVTDEVKVDPVLLASLDEDGSARASFVYDPTGKRDPFLPFDLAPKQINNGATELENYAIGQLRYASYLGSAGEPIAIVENAVHKGFTVRRGTKIGPNGGVVVEILPNKIQILETSIDPITNEKKNNTIELEIRPTSKK